MSKADLKDYADIPLNLSSSQQSSVPTPRMVSLVSTTTKSSRHRASLTFTTRSRPAPPIPAEIFFATTTSSADTMPTRNNDENDDRAAVAPACPFGSTGTDDKVTQMTDRQRFAIFFKILVLYLIRTTPEQKERIVIHRNLKALVRECTRNNNLKTAKDDKCYVTLTQRLGDKLRSYVGEQVWRRSEECFQAYCRSRQLAA